MFSINWVLYPRGKMCTCRTTDETRKQHRLIFDCIYLDTCRLGCFRKLPHRTQTQSPYSLIKEELKQNNQNDGKPLGHTPVVKQVANHRQIV